MAPTWVCSGHGLLRVRRSEAGLHGPRRRPADDRPDAGAAAIAEDADPLGERARRPWKSRRDLRSARPRRLRSPVGDVALLDAGLRAPMRGPARPSRG